MVIKNFPDNVSAQWWKLQVTENNGEWNIRRTTTIFYRLVKLRFKIFTWPKDQSLFNSCRHNQGCRFQVPYRWKVWRGDPGQESSQVLLAILASTSQVCLFCSSIVTVDGNKFIHKSTAKVEGVTGHTVITEFCGDKVTRWAMIIMLRILILIVTKSTVLEMITIEIGMSERSISSTNLEFCILFQDSFNLGRLCFDSLFLS